jgi:glutamine synthetase
MRRGKYMATESFFAAPEKGFGFCDVVFGWDMSDHL